MLVAAVGLEPTTYGLCDRRSSHLSYTATLTIVREREARNQRARTACPRILCAPQFYPTTASARRSLFCLAESS